MKDPIIYESKNGYKVVIPRVSEARAILNSVSIEDMGSWKTDIGWTTRDLKIYLQAMLFTGLRFRDLLRIRQHPELYRSDGTITISRSEIGGGKKKVRIRSYDVYLSEVGRKIFDEQFFSVNLPDSKFLKDGDVTINAKVDAILDKAAEKLGFPLITQKVTMNRKVLDENGLPMIQDGEAVRRTVIEEYRTHGIKVGSWRKAWDSWLVNGFSQIQDATVLIMIEKSMGHSIAIAREHYLTLKYDLDDIEDIKKVINGYGTRTRNFTFKSSEQPETETTAKEG